MLAVEPRFIAAGGNRHPTAADWDAEDGRLAYGTGNNVAVGDRTGIKTLLVGHSDRVNVVKFFRLPSEVRSYILSGGVDASLRVWQSQNSETSIYNPFETLTDHSGAINALDVLPSAGIFASGAADASVRIWKFEERKNSKPEISLLQVISISPKFFPLTVALSGLPGSKSSILAIAGTKNIIKVYSSDPTQRFGPTAVATLVGHEDWIRSLHFVHDGRHVGHDLLLASASQDKYIRLWRVRQETHKASQIALGSNAILSTLSDSLSNKAYRFVADDATYSISFEALLVGHEDWIYTTSWNRNGSKLQLLSASADNSLAIWEPEETSGVWVCIARVGELTTQKGATTATGSTGGFWIGLWGPKGRSIMSLGRTGSWRLWDLDEDGQRWVQQVGLGGHIGDVTDLAWAKGGSYLLSTSSDQTTRLWAQQRGSSWHEFSRPQIHGYDLNCIDTITDSQFISGADEKLLRVFDEPKAIAKLLKSQCGISHEHQDEMPDAANIPVLGLSNKAIQSAQAEEHIQEEGAEYDGGDISGAPLLESLNLDHPPYEEHLARHTLWPEREKLYGHGYEICAVAASHDMTLVATACRASSIDHAVIRIFETKEWHEISPPLMAHSLTVTRLSFSEDDQYLLSVGRDRQWAVFERCNLDMSSYKLFASNTKGHSRMILDCAWAPVGPYRVFATAGRDKTAKLWTKENDTFINTVTIQENDAITAVAFIPKATQGCLVLAAGTEHGLLSIRAIKVEGLMVLKTFCLDQSNSPSGSITRLAWRPSNTDSIAAQESRQEHTHELAVASGDSSLRLYSVKGILDWTKP